MRRRTLVAAPFAAGLLVLPMTVARGQTQPASSLRVGILFPGRIGARRRDIVQRGMSEVLGDITDRVAIEARSAEGNAERLKAFAAELAAVSAPVDVILALGSLALQYARDVTKKIPIVALDLETDPIASGVASTLARPGGNVTGIFFDAPEVAGKWLQFLSEIVPSLSRVALLYDKQTDLTQLRAGEDAAHLLRLQTFRIGVGSAAELKDAFKAIVAAKSDAVLAHSSPIFVDNAEPIAALALENRLPSIMLFPVYARVGGLISYGPDNFELLQQAGAIVGKVLQGASPADLPIERPSRFSLVINLKTAQSLGLVVPHSLVLSADEVVE
jgi:putative tryptophan/tyrosine transport system substrate-binding protein